MSALKRRLRVDRLVTAVLAVASCAGLTALVAVRSAEQQDAAAATVTDERASLDAYAEQLTREAARLQAYRSELRRVAAELAQGDVGDTGLVERIASETRAPGSPAAVTTLDRDTATYSS